MGIFRKKGEIFCGYCKYYSTNLDIGNVTTICKNEEMWYSGKKNPTEEDYDKNCRKINKNNDCIGFMKK